jgi:RNA-directed DNA polymerase
MTISFRRLYDKICTFENIYNAYTKARRGKRHTDEVLEFEYNLEANLHNIQDELINQTYTTGKYRRFKVFEPKEREIAALPFKDRIVQHAIYKILMPIYEARFIHQSYACRENKGTHAGADQAERMMRIVQRNHGQVYALKADIAKYFYSVDHKVLKEQLKRHIQCKKTINLLEDIIDSTNSTAGIPIGNLTSQLFANLYLHDIDMYIKSTLKEKYYTRYMDDFVVIHHDKRHLQEILVKIKEYLTTNLKLTTNAKTQIFEVVSTSRSLDFLGYKIWTTHRNIRKSSAKRMTRQLKIFRKQPKTRETFAKQRASVRSWLAHCKKANSKRIVSRILNYAN